MAPVVKGWERVDQNQPCYSHHLYHMYALYIAHHLDTIHPIHPPTYSLQCYTRLRRVIVKKFHLIRQKFDCAHRQALHCHLDLTFLLSCTEKK